MAEVKRGEIWLCAFPKPDHRRPVLVLHHVATVPRNGLKTYVSTVSLDVMEAVRESLLFALGWGVPRAAPCAAVGSTKGVGRGRRR